MTEGNPSLNYTDLLHLVLLSKNNLLCRLDGENQGGNLLTLICKDTILQSNYQNKSWPNKKIGKKQPIYCIITEIQYINKLYEFAQIG